MKSNCFIALLSLLISSCSVYVPQTHAPILIKEKGELQIDASLDATFTMVASGSASITYGISDRIICNIRGMGVNYRFDPLGVEPWTQFARLGRR